MDNLAFVHFRTWEFFQYINYQAIIHKNDYKTFHFCSAKDDETLKKQEEIM